MMRYTLNINGKSILAERGETLVDAALMGKILIPHDCATGHCETCRVNVPYGSVDTAGTAYGNTVLACRSRVVGDATITFETAPELQKVVGKVHSIAELSDKVVEVCVQIAAPLHYRPGQYAKVQFAGFPAREYSFAAKMDQEDSDELVVFQVKKLRQGRVSTALGDRIKVGHRVRLQGPFGNAFLRDAETGPLVLASSGTGFAPIWSLSKALVKSRHRRNLTIVTGLNSPADMYMLPAFRWLADHGEKNVTIVSREMASGLIRKGTPDQHLPDLDQTTSVHVAGNPNLVERVKQKALAVNAHCYADPFTPSQNRMSLWDRLPVWPFS